MNTDAIQAQAAYLLTHADGAERLGAVTDFTDFTAFTDAERERVLKVQAFIIKVKHAAIRREAPCTFRLLTQAGLELRFFAAFAPAYLAARRHGPIATLPHLTLLRDAFQRFKDIGEPVCALMADMFDHEFALSAAIDHHPARLADGAFLFDGACVLGSSRYDLPALRQQQGVGPAACVPGARRYLLVQRTACAASARVLALDALTAMVVHASSRAPHARAVAEHLRQASPVEFSEDVVHAVFDALRGRGVGKARVEQPA